MVLDPLNKKRPDYEKKKQILDKIELMDTSFISPSALNFYKNSKFLFKPRRSFV